MDNFYTPYRLHRSNLFGRMYECGSRYRWDKCGSILLRQTIGPVRFGHPGRDRGRWGISSHRPGDTEYRPVPFNQGYSDIYLQNDPDREKPGIPGKPVRQQRQLVRNDRKCACWQRHTDHPQADNLVYKRLLHQREHTGQLGYYHIPVTTFFSSPTGNSRMSRFLGEYNNRYYKQSANFTLIWCAGLFRPE